MQLSLTCCVLSKFGVYNQIRKTRNFNNNGLVWVLWKHRKGNDIFNRRCFFSLSYRAHTTCSFLYQSSELATCKGSNQRSSVEGCKNCCSTCEYVVGNVGFNSRLQLSPSLSWTYTPSPSCSRLSLACLTGARRGDWGDLALPPPLSPIPSPRAGYAGCIKLKCPTFLFVDVTLVHVYLCLHKFTHRTETWGGG